MEQPRVNQFHFTEPKKVKLRPKEYSAFTHHQLIAIIKSVTYLIAADNRVTANEKFCLNMLCSKANVSNPEQAFEESKVMRVEDMFSTIYSMSKEQKDAVLYEWIMIILYSGDNIHNPQQVTFNLNMYPREKAYFIDMARRCNIDVSAFLNGSVILV